MLTGLAPGFAELCERPESWGEGIGMGAKAKQFCLGLCALAFGALVPVGTSAVRAEEAPAVPPLILEDFEGVSLGTIPYLWKSAQNATQGTAGAEKVELDGSAANKALKLEYTFPAGFSADQQVSAGPGLREFGAGQELPGSLTGISMVVFGDNSKNAVSLTVQDRMGESFEWRTPITWSGWRKVLFPMDPRTASRAGSRANGVLDLPLTFKSVGLQRLQGGMRAGEVMVDNLAAACSFGKITTLYDTTSGVKLDGWAAKKNRSTIGGVGESLVPRSGKDVPVLKLEYGYENGADSSVEYSKTLLAGEGHGTLIAEVFGDGSNNVLRFRMLDGQDHVWQATWAQKLVDWSGWKTLYLDTRTLKEPEARDATAIMEKFPVKFQSLIIDDCSAGDQLPGVESGRMGEIYLGRLLFCSGK